jgi:hypothetical protein
MLETGMASRRRCRGVRRHGPALTLRLPSSARLLAAKALGLWMTTLRRTSPNSRCGEVLIVDTGAITWGTNRRSANSGRRS